MRNRLVGDSPRETLMPVGTCGKGRRRGFPIIPLVVVLLFLILCRSGESNDQTKATDSNAEFSASENVTNPASFAVLTFASTYQAGSGPALTLATNEVVHGIIQLPSGPVYEGELAAGLPQGEGTVTDQYGTKQSGQWRYGEPFKVSGKAVYPDGTTEVGTWNNDGSKSGGTITWKDGRVYKGDWKISEAPAPEVPDGTGEMSWPNGRKYNGQFRDGEMDGAGKMTYPGGKIEDGSWAKGRFLGATK